MSLKKYSIILIIISITNSLDINTKPIIGIYSNEYPSNDSISYNKTQVGIPYIRWLESSGANVLIIQQWYSDNEIDNILNNINGVLLLGDGKNTLNQTWGQKLIYLINSSLKKNIPIWATCSSFEIIHSFISGKNVLEFGFDDTNVIHSFNNISNNSKMFSLFNQSLLNLFNEFLGYYNHKFSINKTRFNNEKKLTDFFKITSLSKDMKSKQFINSVEGINKNIYATQFHPEKVPFQRKEYNVEYEKNSIRVSTLLGIFFVEECRKNKNRFNLDKKNYYFIDSYGNNNQNFSIDSKKEIIIFTHNYTNQKSTKNKPNKNIYIILIIILIIIISIVGIYLFMKNKKIQNDILDENEISEYQFSK